MSKGDKSRQSDGFGWFWIGAGAGFVLSAAAVLFATEFNERRKLRAKGIIPDDDSFAEDIGYAVQHGISVFSDAAKEISQTFKEARRELVRYGLDPGGAGSGESGWYMEDLEAESAAEGDESVIDFDHYDDQDAAPAS